MRSRSWWPVPVVAAAVVGTALPWTDNPLTPARSGWTVLTGGGASAPVTLLFFAAVAVAVVGVVAGAVASGAPARRRAAGVAVVAAAAGLACLGWYGVGIATERVRAIGLDLATGATIEPEAVTRLGVGWYLTVGAVLTVALVARGRPTVSTDDHSSSST